MGTSVLFNMAFASAITGEDCGFAIAATETCEAGVAAAFIESGSLHAEIKIALSKREMYILMGTDLEEFFIGYIRFMVKRKMPGFIFYG